MITGAAVVPTAPLLVPGVTARLPGGLTEIADATGTALCALPPCDTAVLLAAAPAGSPPGVFATAQASLAGIGRADLVAEAEVDRALAGALGGALGCPLTDASPLPLGLAVLVHLWTARRPATPVVPLTVAPSAAGRDLLTAGGTLARTTRGPAAWAGARSEVAVGAGPAVSHGPATRGPVAAGERRVVVVAPGDLSAGLTPKAPLALVDGARAWDDEVVDAAAGGRLERVARLGPDEAARVGALGWAPLVVLAGACRAAGLATVVRRYRAPRGVGYLVAAGG